MRILPNTFFNRKTLTVARELPGKYLVRKLGGKIIRQKITEVEAYIGPHDLASHSRHGKTSRNEAMFMRAGTIYVYFTYGMHWMLNISTDSEGMGAAVLIRGTSEVSGPGRLTKALKIDEKLNGKSLGKKTGLWIEENPESSKQKIRILRSPRIGIGYAGVWADKPYRFLLP